MKKNFKRLVAIVAAVAMTVTGMTFTPAVKSVDAATSWISVTGVPSGAWGGKKSQYTLGTTSDTDGNGKWDLEVSQNQWGNWAGRYKNADSIDGFSFNNQVYNNAGGVFLWSHDLKSEYGLTAGTDYEMTVTIDYEGVNAAQHNYVLTEGGTNNMNISRTVAKGASQETYTADVKPGSGDFILRLSWTTANYQTAEVATFTVASVTFTPKETTTNLYDWQRCPFDNSDFVPEAGSPWTLKSNNNASSAWGNQYYKMDSSKQVSDISRMHLKKDYVDGSNKNDWWWDSASLYGYGTTLGLDNGSSYTGTIVINTDTATSGSHTIRIVAFNHQYDFPLTAGDNELTIPKFKYNPAESDDIQFDYVEMPQNAEFYIKSISFSSIYDGWTKAPFAEDSAIANSNWSTSVNNDGSNLYGDIRYKHDTTVATNDPARIKFKMAGAIGEAERTPQGARITDPAQRWWWMSADLTGNYKATVNKADGTSQTGNIRTILEEDERYTASIVVNASDATLTDDYDNDTKLFVTPFGGTEQAFDLAAGDNTLSLQEFAFDGSDANIKFLFDELVADSELTVKSVTFTQVDDGWHKVKPNQDVTPSGSPWTLYADYQPDTDLSDGDQGLYGDMWYKVDGSGVSGTSIKPKSVAVGECFYWNKATLKNYLSKSVAQGGAGLQDGHSYTGTITISYTAGDSEAGKTPKLRYVVAEAGTGEADKVLNNGSGTYTINLSEFLYNSADENQDILFDLTGLEKDSIFKVNSITFTEVDADWTNVKGDTATATPWTLTANYDGVEAWGHMRYKQSGSGVSSVQIKPMATAMGNHYYWNNAVLEDYLSDVANLTDGVEYDAQIKVQYTAGEAEAGKTPQLRYIMAAADTGEANFNFNQGSNTYTIDLPTFTYDASAGKDDIEFELDGLEKKSIFKVTEITFSPTGWTKVPKNTAFVPTGTPWTLTATNDQSTPGEEQWGDMSYKVDGTASNISSTLIKPNATAVGEHFYWNKAELKNYLATLQDGHSYTGSITFNYVSGTAVSGKTPELRTVIAAAGTGEMDTAVTAGSNTISISEFIYDSTAANKDILFELDGLEEGSVFQVTAVNFTEVDADWTNLKGGTATVTPWILTANNNGTDQWGHLRYKQTGTGVSSVQVKPMNTSMGDHFYWNTAKLTDMTYGQTLTPGKEYSAVITVQYTAGEVESGKTPELQYSIPVAEVSEAKKVLNNGSGTYTINVPAFAYDSNANNSVEFELDSLEKKSVFKVTDITFTDTGWTKVTQNSDPDNPTTVNPTGTPWTLRADWIPDEDLSDGDQGMYGDMSYKVTGTASNVSATQLKINKSAVGEHFYWETATLKNYLNTLEDGCSYTGSITVNYTPGTAEAGKTPQLRTIIEGAYDGNIDTNLSSGSNTISIDEFIYSSADTRKDIMFELTGLEAGSIFQVTGLTFTKLDSDWTNVKGGSDTATPWILTANNDGDEAWGHLRYKQTGTGVSSVQVKPMSVSMGDHFYWNTAKLTDIAYGQTLTAGNEYTAVITVQYTAGETESGKTPELLYNIPVAGVSEETKALNNGSGTYTINVPAFTYDSSADNYAEFELDSLEKKSVFKVNSIVFTPTGWKQVPKNTEFVPTDTPWTLKATNDQSTPGEEQWGDMSYKIDGTASAVNGTLIRANATDVGEHYYWNTATLKDYMASLDDGCSYTGSITVNYTAGKAVSGKTPELRTVIEAAKTGEKDTALTAGTNTISIDEFIYNSADENQDILFELDGLEEGSVFQVTGITFTKQDADWTNVKGGSDTATPWIITANNDGEESWGHLRYKKTATSVSGVQIKPMSVSMGDHFYWNTAKLTDMAYGQSLTAGNEYTAVITVQYTAGEAESGKTPELLYNIPAAGISEETKALNNGSGTYTINVPAFTYDSSADNYAEFELDSLEKKSVFKVNSIVFTPTGWKQVPKNTEFVPTGTPWTLKATNDQSTPGEEQWGDMSYKIDGTASAVNGTLIRPNATDVGEHYYWNTATLKNYMATLEDGCSYTGSITVNYTAGEAVAGKTPELRTVIEAAKTGEKDTALTAGTNTISISEFIYNSADENKDILFELDGLEKGSVFQVTGITFTKQDADWTNVKGDEANPDPWILTANYDGVTQWGHMRYKQTGTGVSSVQVKPMNTSMGDHFYWNSAKLTDMTYGQTLTPGKEYTAVITVQYTAGEVESGKTPELQYSIPVAEVSEAKKVLNNGSGTYTISVPAFAYDSNANNSVEFELDSLEKKSVFKVTDITFTDTGWTKVTQNSDPDNPTTVNPSGTPWTLRADWIPDEDLSDGDQGMYGDMSYKVTGTASNVSATQLKINKSAVGEHFYWETATLKNYLNTLEDGCSYTGSITVNYTPGTAEAGKTPQLRTIIEGAYDGNIDTNLSSGTNTISIDEFIYSDADTRKDIMFELTGLEAGSIFQVTAINFTKQDSDWTNVKGGSDTATPWILTANNDGDEAWGHLRYKQTGTGVSSVQVKPINTSMGDHFYWNSAKLSSIAYGQSLTAGNEYTAVITLNYTAGTAEASKTPEVLYNIPAAGISEETMTLSAGTNTINVPEFTYDANADNSLELELDSLEAKSIIQVTDITFTPTGWKQVPKNTEFTPTGTPWTLEATNDQSTPGEEQWGDMSYKIDGTASAVNGTLIRPNATDVGEHYYWNTATLKDYMASLDDGCSYTGSITVNYTAGKAVSGKTPELRTVIEAAKTGEKDTALTAGSNTISIDEFIYNSADENQDILFELDGLEEGSVFQVTGITFTKQDADWTNVKGESATATPWTLTANNDGDEAWGHLRYKQTGTGVSSVQVKPINTSMGDHFYWNSAKLSSIAYGQTLTAGNEYTAVITVQYTAGEAESGKTPELLYNIPAAGISEETKALNNGSGTYTINVPAFTYDANADNSLELELDSLEKKSIIQVTDITFTSTGWKQVPKNTEFVPTDTPWTLKATNDQSTPGEEQWGDMSYKIDGTASAVNGTLIRPNATDVGEHYYWNTATLKNYMATLEDGCSYTGSITVNYTAGEAVAGKTPELRTVIEAAKTGEKDTALTAGTNTISISEFIYNSADENKDILFEFDGLEKGSVFQVTGITFTKQDADWTNVKGDSATPTPWTLTANYDGVANWGHMRYKQTGTGVSSVEIKPINTAVGEHYYWNNAVLEDYLSDGANLTDGVEYDAQIKVQYTAGQAEAGKTPQLRYIVAAAETGEANFDFDEGSKTYTIDLPTFTYDENAGKDDIEFELDGLEKQSIFKVSEITFTPTGWTKVPNNTEFVPTGTPWTLKATNDQSTPGEEQWGDMSYKVTGTASDISATQIRPNATDVGEHYYWNTATLKNYMATLEDGCSYTGSITVNYTAGEAVSGKTPELRTVIEAAGTGEMDTTVTAGSNTISIGEFLYDSTAANKDILFELDGLEKGSVFQVTGITFTKQDADWTNVKGDEANPDPWTITANYDGVTQWGHMRYKQTGTGVSSVQIKPINTSVGEHFYWNNAKLIDYLSDTANLEDGKEYEGTITVSYTAGQAEAGKTPQLRYIVAAANTGEANLNLSSGTNTYEIDLGKFVYDASAGNDNIEFELDGLEKQSIFQVTDITFEPTGWERIEQNDEVVPTDSQGNNTPWTLVATNDGEQQWGDMSVKVDGTASDVASTSIKLNTAAEGEHFYWNTATLKDYLATLDDGCSYTGSIVVNYTSGEAEAGKTPELRTVIAGAFDGSKDTTLTNGLNTIALDEFVYDASKGEDDILFELTGLEKGSIFNVASITFTKQDADWTNVKGDTADVDPWTITATNDGSTSWGHIRYKKTGSGVSSVQMKPMSVAMGNHYYWNTASLEGYLADNLVDGTEYTGTITLSYTAGQAEAGKTPQLRYVVAAADTGEANLNLTNGTNIYTINLDSFVYDANAGKNDIMFELDSLEKGSIFQVTDITFTPTGWKNVPKNEEFTPTGTPWTLQSLNDGSTMWGEMQYRVDGTASNIANTTIKMTNPGGNNEWNFATLEDYLSDKMSAGHTYSCSIAYTVAGAISGNTMTIKVGNNDGSVESVQNGENTYAISSFEYDGTNTDILFMPDKLAKNATFKVTSISINQLDVGYENVPANVQGGFNPTDTPWRLTVTNDGSTSYGAMKYKVDGTPSNISNTKMRLVTNSGSSSYSWTSAKLPGYATTLGLETDFTYGGSIVINPEAEGIITVYVDGTAYTQDLSESHTIAIPDFVYKGDEPGAGGSSDIVFMFDQMVDGTDFSVSSINIDRIDTQDGFEKVPANQDFTPAGSIWTINAANNSSTTWGKMWYKVDDTAEPTDIGNTTVRMINGNEEYKWDTMSLKNYINNDQLEGPELEKDKLYSATITYNYDPNPDSGNGKSGAGEDEVTATVCNADPVTATVTEGTGNTIAVGEFAYDGESNDIVFILDGLKAGSEFTVTGIEFTESDWTRVPDNDPNFKIPVGYEYDFRDTDGVMRTKNSGTYDWTVFAGEWGGHGAILYYDKDLTKADQPKVRIGAGEKYDPACAQFKLPNTSAYQDLKYYTSYYMTYTFYSSEAGTVHITHEGYEPNHPERIDVVKGLNTYKKYVTRIPGQDYLNLYMSLTPTTYGDGGVIINDGTALPEGTVLSNFKVEFQKTVDANPDYYTLVNDCRYEEVQDHTPIINSNVYNDTVFYGYCNSWLEGWLSYDANTDATRADQAIADTKLHLDSTSGNAGTMSNDFKWPESIRIPNKYFYGNREATSAAELASSPIGTDTNGDELVDGQEYKLRIYYNAQLPEGTSMPSGKGVIVKREGYDEVPIRYSTNQNGGLNMINGTISPKGGYTSHDNYSKTGGIDITYDDDKRTTTRQWNTDVKIDFSEFPEGTVISDISWEFYTAQKFTAKVVDANDGTVYGDIKTVAEGSTYTVPTVDGVTNYTYEGQPIQPGTNITVADDIVIYVTPDANSHKVTILNPDNTVKKVDVVSDGGNYTFPQAKDDYKNVKTFEAVSGATDDQAPGSTITNVTNDKVYKIANQYTVTIKDSDGTVLDTWTVDAGDSFQFPEDTGKYDGVKKFNGIVTEGTTGSYDPEAIIASVDKDLVFQVQREFKVIIDGVPVATVPEGDSYTFPAATGTYAGVDHFTDDDENFFAPEYTFTPTGDVVVSSVYKVKIFGEDGTLMLSTDVSKGDNYTFPLATGEFADVKDFKGINGTSGTYNPGGQVTVNTNLNYQIEKKAETDHTITIYEKDGTTVRETITVEDGGSASLPDGNTPGYDDVASYLEGSTPRALGYTYTNVTEDISVKVVPYEYTITIVDANGDTLVSETHDAGYVYTFPASIGQIDHIKDYKGIDGTTGTKLPTETVTLDSNKKYQVEELEQYTITIDGNVVDTVYEGETYTFPTPAHVTEFSDNDAPGTTYEPGQTITPDRDIDVDTVYETYTVKIVDTDGTTELKSTTVTYNDSYTFPTTAEQGFEHAKDFVGIAGSSATKTPGSTIDNVDRDMTFQIERQYTITIYNTDGITVKDTFTVDEGDDQTLPNNQTTGYEDVKEYTDGQNTYPLGYTFENVQEDKEVQVVPKDTPTYTWSVDGVQQGDPVPAGTTITLPNTAQIGYLLEYVDGQDKGVTDDLYKPADTYEVNRNVNFISINSVTLSQAPGACMRFEEKEESSTDLRGIGFEAQLKVNGGKNADILASSAFETGMLITPYDCFVYQLDEDMTREKATTKNSCLVDVSTVGEGKDKWLPDETSGERLPGRYRCGITKVKDGNYDRDFVARAYTTINYVDGTSETVYVDNPTQASCRNILYIAKAIKADTEYYNSLSDYRRRCVDAVLALEEE